MLFSPASLCDDTSRGRVGASARTARDDGLGLRFALHIPRAHPQCARDAPRAHALRGSRFRRREPAPRAMSPTKRFAPRTAGSARAVRASRAGSAVAECRVAETFAALRTPEAREETWRATAAPPSSDGPVGADADADERARRAARLGKLRSTKNDARRLALGALDGGLPGGKQRRGRARGQAPLIAARRRASGDEETRDRSAANAAGGARRRRVETTSEPRVPGAPGRARVLGARVGFQPVERSRGSARSWVGGTLGSKTAPARAAVRVARGERTCTATSRRTARATRPRRRRSRGQDPSVENVENVENGFREIPRSTAA